ncbi:putative mitochondrial protein AtMg00310 [Silene latifolia]|uniref:putative mitochondrial protein AtMg00310 n=1 Tax=Silene latifolia TaxID=37657 RepID=UPI003D780326
MVENQDKYLGLPTMVSHSKKVISSVVRDKISKKLQGWRGMLLFKAGREVLIKAVAQSIPTYAMSVFKLPVNFCDELRSLVSSFWWGSEGGKRKIPWIAWRKLCEPKCKGGLAFRDFMSFNKALLGKQGWRLLTNGESLMSRILKGKYFHDRSFLEANLGTNPSYTWRGIWESKEVLHLGIRRRIRNGESTQVWHDTWIPGTQSRKVISPRGNLDSESTVRDLMNNDGERWDEHKIRETFVPLSKSVYSVFA